MRKWLRPVSVASLSGMVLLTGCGSGAPGEVHGTGINENARSSASGGVSACASSPKQGAASVMVDWVDFVKLNSIEYVAGPSASTRSAPALKLGPVVGRVRCQLSALTFSQPPGPAVDGDAAFLPVGTEVHAIAGIEPTCRVAAEVGGSVRVYLAHGEVNGVSRPLTCATAS
jgi:hypothetical protein